MLGRFWGKQEKKKDKKRKRKVKSQKTEKEKIVEKKSIKTKSGKLLQIIETKLKYKYNIKNLFEIMLDLGPLATKLHISTGYPPYFRYNEQLLASDLPALTEEDTEALLLEYCPEKKLYEFEENYTVEFCSEISGVTKFKATLTKENDGISGVFSRVFPQTMSIDQLKLPKTYKEIAKNENGFIIVSGAAGSGKTTTVAALIKFISNTRHNRILILDKPVEFEHPTKKALVIHKEIGVDVSSYREGIEQALEEDIDILVIGEIQDKETILLALEASQRGMLVIGEFYTTGALKTLEHIVKLFPPAKKEYICSLLSEHLNAIISQIIVKTKDKLSVRVVSEVFLSTPEIKVLLNQGSFYQIPVIMERDKKDGMQTFTEEIGRLIKQNKISPDIAEEHSSTKGITALR